MDRSILAARRGRAMETIEENFRVDISRSALPKAPTTELFQLFQLEKIAETLEGFSFDEKDPLEEILLTIYDVPGVGEKLYEKIEEALRE